MRSLRPLLLIVAASLFFSAQAYAQAARERVSFNADWRFEMSADGKDLASVTLTLNSKP
ncbi:MAG: hypothetical protein V4857_29640 [Pseudomonadota bacterium]